MVIKSSTFPGLSLYFYQKIKKSIMIKSITQFNSLKLQIPLLVSLKKKRMLRLLPFL